MWRCAMVLALTAVSSQAYGLDIRSDYSPLNRQRPLRPRTDYIVLHTTEGAARGALAKLRRLGEAHYLVDERGRVTRIIHHRRIATHAGTALWDGHRDLDRRSLGIEVAGYHDGRLRPAQVRALRELLRQLQSMYRVPDRRVLTHSMVAYGTPHRYHPYPHRGRKRCGMLFARPKVRKALGLLAAPRFDPDVRARRVRVADRELFRILFPPKRRTPAMARRREPPSRRQRASKPVQREPRLPDRSRVSRRRGRTDVVRVARSGRSARAWVGEASRDPKTIYLFPSGLVRTGADLEHDAEGRRLLLSVPRGTRILLDKQFAGYVTAGRAPSQIAGSRWDDPSTLYRLPDGDLVPGHRMDAARIPRHTLVFPSS